MTLSNDFSPQSNPLHPRRADLPTMYDLPSEDPPDAWYWIAEWKKRAEEAEQKAIALQMRSEKLAARLRDLGIDPDLIK
jgi:hypothetical protein